jgi:hypothetical protein
MTQEENIKQDLIAKGQWPPRKPGDPAAPPAADSNGNKPSGGNNPSGNNPSNNNASGWSGGGRSSEGYSSGGRDPNAGGSRR